MATNEKRYCVVVPAYREQDRIGKVVEEIRRYCENVVVVDDGSHDNMAKEAEAAGAVVLKHAANHCGAQFAIWMTIKGILFAVFIHNHGPIGAAIMTAVMDRLRT